MGTQKNRLNLGSFEHPKHMFKLIGKKIITILRFFLFAHLDPWTLIRRFSLGAHAVFLVLLRGRSNCVYGSVIGRLTNPPYQHE